MPQGPQKRKEVESGQKDGQADEEQGQAGKDGDSIPVFHGGPGLSGDAPSTAYWKGRLRPLR